VTYTHRFKAAIALAGITELVGEYGEFDRTARSYPGIDHQKSANAGIDELGRAGLGKPSLEDLWRYWRNSPLFFAETKFSPGCR
jgi:dipeptidyl aminopeptidase/acylaminoacyl peptidase